MNSVLDVSQNVSAEWTLHNFRTIGGVRGHSGNMIRAGHVYRSAAPMREPVKVAAGVVETGIVRVIDLRDEREQRSTPDAWQHEALQVLHVPLFGNKLHEMRFDGLEELYGLMIESRGEEIARAFSTLAHQILEPVLLHCTAGKDRTGVLSAILLEVLGADRAFILDDYSRSREMLSEAYLDDLFAGSDREKIPGFAVHRATASPPELLLGAFDLIERNHTSVLEFLYTHGVTAAEVAMVRGTMLIIE